jgi:hypothetical protein
MGFGETVAAHLRKHRPPTPPPNVAKPRPDNDAQRIISGADERMYAAKATRNAVAAPQHLCGADHQVDRFCCRIRIDREPSACLCGRYAPQKPHGVQWHRA